MSHKPQYYIVEASALPEVFLKVAETKRLLSTGEAGTVNEATRMTDISRSAFYKYRDAVMPFQNMMTGRIVTFQLLLHEFDGIAGGTDAYPQRNARRREGGRAGWLSVRAAPLGAAHIFALFAGKQHTMTLKASLLR